MFTRCPRCKSVHPLTAERLTQARGSVKCANCNESFDALSCLFDQWPSGRAHAPLSGEGAAAPVIGKAMDNQITASEEETDTASEASAGTREGHRVAWGLSAVVLVLVMIANVSWTFREPLLKVPVISDQFEQMGWLQVEEDGPLRDPENIRLVSRDMHSHPTRSGILVLSLTFVNLAQRTQVYPQLEVTLLDVSNQPVARRRFDPSEYLRKGTNIDSGLAPDVFLPVLLELGDIGEHAVGFEIRFL